MLYTGPMSAFSSGPGRALEEQPLPEHLIDEILRGQCVAFVGAGMAFFLNPSLGTCEAPCGQCPHMPAWRNVH